MGDGKKRLQERPKSHSIEDHSDSRNIRRSSISLFSRFATAGAMIGALATGSFFNLGNARAEDKKPPLIAQATTVNPASSAIGSVNPSREETAKTSPSNNSDLEKLPKVSLADMQKLADETCRKYDCRFDPKGKELRQAGVVKIKFPGHMMSVIASIGNLDGQKVNKILVMINGKVVGDIPLNKMSEDYEQKTGKKLEQVFIVVANTKAFDPEIGEHVLLYILPRETDKLTRVDLGLKIEVTYGATQKVYSDSDLVAMR